MKFTVPGEPTGKARPKVFRNGDFTKGVTPEKTVLYENLVKVEFQRQCPRQPIIENPVALKIRCFYGLAKGDSKKKQAAKLAGAIRPTKKPDIDNCIKIIADALNGLAYVDDTQIVAVVAEKFFAEIPRVEVEITEVLNESLLDCIP